MIVIEGPDCAGKTTLADALFRAIPERTGRCVMPRHFTKPPTSFDKYWGYKNCIQRDVVLDRFHMSHIAYRAVDGEPHDLTPFKYSLVDADITRAGGLVVLLAPPDEIISWRWHQQPANRQEMYSLDHVLAVAAKFRVIGETRTLVTAHGAYRPRVDVWVANSTPTEDIVERVIQEWCSRQLALDALLEARGQGVLP